MTTEPDIPHGRSPEPSTDTRGIPTHRLVLSSPDDAPQQSRSRHLLGRYLRWQTSIRTRITIAVVAVTLLVSGTLGTVLADQAAQSARESLRDQALARLITASEGYRLDGRLRLGASADSDTAPSAIRQGMDTGERRTYFDGETMWASERLGPESLLTIRLEAAELRDQDQERVRTLILAMLVAALLTTAVAYAVATTLSRRLRRAALAATEIAEGNPTSRTFQGGHDEVAALTLAVDRMASTLQERLEAERAFTGDVAHELRTPVTGLVSAVELLSPSRATSLVQGQVDRLRRLVEDLLEVSRLESGSEVAHLEERDLVRVTEQTLANLSLHNPGVEVDLREDQSALVLVEPRRYERILANLLANVARHAQGQCTLTVVRQSVVVDDDGPGYPSEILDRGPQRFHGSGGAKGTGLGLTIITKQAALMGAEVTFDRAPSGGARCVVKFVLAPPGAPEHS